MQMHSPVGAHHSTGGTNNDDQRQNLPITFDIGSSKVLGLLGFGKEDEFGSAAERELFENFV